VLFSPAGTSFDAYRNFEERGEEFRRIVQDMQQAEAN
jgi:UDP-N-acetylmuramoylalanine-D-glutamate ligase